MRPWLGGTHVIDLSETVANPDNFAFLTDDQNGGYIYHKLAPGLYMVHTISLPEGRGRQMLDARSGEPAGRCSRKATRWRSSLSFRRATKAPTCGQATQAFGRCSSDKERST